MWFLILLVVALVMPLDPKERLRLAEAAKLDGCAVPTIWRWALRPNKHKVKLITWVFGGVRFTSREALQLYAEETTAVADRLLPPASPRAWS